MRARSLIVFAVLLCVSAVWAQPGTLGYQGIVLNSSGQPVPNGIYRMLFELYPVETGSSPFWSETDGAVPVTSGLFSTILGDDQPFGLTFLMLADLWLQVTVDVNRNGTLEANEVFSPRQQLCGTPWESHRLEPNLNSPNVIGGHGANYVAPGRYGATIGGGGSLFSRNRVWDNFGTVGGGEGNVAGGLCAAVVGGTSNSAHGRYAFVGGGENNAASGQYSVVGGGVGNYALGEYSTVPGGFGNGAYASCSFAAGRWSDASHDGAFVWNDSNLPNFYSARPYEFAVRASNGMRLCDSPITGYESQLFVSCMGKPQLYLYGTESGDFARLRMANSTYETQFWDIATLGGVFNIWYNGDGQNILQLLPDDATNLLMMRNGARLTNGGAWTNASDRDAKTNFAPVNGRQILDELVATPIMTWNYKSEPESMRHMGPTAQDFRGAFGLGSDDKTISTIDADGVALAAIQGLHQLAVEQNAQIATLRQQNAEMQTRLAALEAAVARMAAEPSPH